MYIDKYGYYDEELSKEPLMMIILEYSINILLHFSVSFL
jgi:hypothetical protein